MLSVFLVSSFKFILFYIFSNQSSQASPTTNHHLHQPPHLLLNCSARCYSAGPSLLLKILCFPCSWHTMHLAFLLLRASPSLSSWQAIILLPNTTYWNTRAFASQPSLLHSLPRCSHQALCLQRLSRSQWFSTSSLKSRLLHTIACLSPPGCITGNITKRDLIWFPKPISLTDFPPQSATPSLRCSGQRADTHPRLLGFTVCMQYYSQSCWVYKQTTSWIFPPPITSTAISKSPAIAS